MSSTEPCAVCLQPWQVVLGTTAQDDFQPESSRHAVLRHKLQRNDVTFLAGREPRDSITVQASFDQVCVLSRDQRFDQALPFWHAFSGSQNADQPISCTAVGLSAERDHIFVAAATDHRIAVWSAPAMSSTLSRKWKVHSTLTVNEGVVTTLDINRGQLLTGTTSSLALWRLDSSDIPIWKRFWNLSVPAPVSVARLSPDATTIAAVARGGQYILLWQYQPRSTKPPVLQQHLYHPRPVTSLAWRHPPELNSQADVLISHASDGVARMWAPVIDEPTQLRLWCSVQGTHSSAFSDTTATFYLDAYVLSAALRANIGVLQREIQMAELGVGSSTELDVHRLELDMDLRRTRLRRLEQLVNETPDMFVSLEQDRFLNVTAVANVDRRPPTLLQALTVLRIPFGSAEDVKGIVGVQILPLHVAPDASSTDPMLMLHVQLRCGSSTAYAINPATFFDGRGLGIRPDDCHPCGPSASRHPSAESRRRHTDRVESLQRSGDGKVLLSSSTGESIAWLSDASPKRPMGSLRWQSSLSSSPLVAVSWDGLLTAQVGSDGVGEVRMASGGAATPFNCDDDVQHLTFSHFVGVDVLIAVIASGAVHSWAVAMANEVRIIPCQMSRLWSDVGTDRRLTLVDSISGSPAEPGKGLHLVFADTLGRFEAMHATRDTRGQLRWTAVALLRESSGIPQRVRCNVDGLFAAVTRDDQGTETLVIFDLKTSSFSSGEEHRQSFGAEESVVGLDWSPSPLSSNMLAVAFHHHVDIVAPRRFSPYEAHDATTGSQWQLLVRLDLRSCTSSAIRAACWIGSEQLVIASGSLLFLYGPFVQPSSQVAGEPKKVHLAELVAEVGGPVVQYHPAFLLQCAIWGKMEVAMAVISNLENAVLAYDGQDTGDSWAFQEVPLDAVLLHDSAAGNGRTRSALPSRHTVDGSIFDELDRSDDADDSGLFGLDRIDSLAQRIRDVQPPHLSPSDLDVLVNLVKSIGEVAREHRSLDPSGLRYTLALRQMLNRTDMSKQAKNAPSIELTYRDYLWAFHSDNQETLLAYVESAYPNKLDWRAARSAGLFTWLKNPSALRTQAEAVARAQFMSSEDRDPVKCSLLYSALGKRKVVQGLWRQAVWHPEQKKMLQFLSHDFDEQRWKTAAQKNAFALLSQRRYEFAASFFMLGESLRDAVNVCVRNLDDLPLAIALARIKEGCDDGPVLTDLLKTRVLPLAFERGDRWMGSWAFWMLKRRDLAVRIIVTPLRDLIADKDVASLLGSTLTCGNDSYGDPALALLFQQLRSKSLQTIKGLYDIPEKKVFDFVLNTNRALCRMGCHSIGLSLLRNWQFEPPSMSSASTLFHRVSRHDLETLSRVDETVLSESTDAFSELRLHDDSGRGPKSPTIRRRTSQSTISPPSSPRMHRRRSSLIRRRSSIINDLDIGAALSSQSGKQEGKNELLTSEAGAPKSDAQVQAERGHGDSLTAEPSSFTEANGHSEEKEKSEMASAPKKQGISIFKSAAASNSQQGAQEFDFGSFGF
ncbi:hypothetical protein PHSY_007154 [Pseudozyma hubeiensis SY62]|uniref:RAVE complex protein Rav1 C-terminal domain-containing protein n=1 Tax=Pseudozyma hubeiensis (strain SY62) TaxID=1305764 RepID=R9PE71_PSEHS|nr:hypothetical protein PHSY_007154 [Pseudozyma hubeiensis SY62]GAC99552.1 hypothetical protein PHSY_007154 [Pseudozyma hubeiensis SY62]